MKNAVLLVSGGAGNGANAAIASTVRTLEKRNYKVLGIRKGFEGMSAPNIKNGQIVVPLLEESIDVTEEGCIIGSSREAASLDQEIHGYNVSDRAESFDTDNQTRANKIWENLKTLNAEMFVVIGGDGTFRSLTGLFKYCPDLEDMTIGLINTMDNDGDTGSMHDIVPSTLCAGYPSAVEKLIKYHKNASRLFYKLKRVFIHETLGRDNGWPTIAVPADITIAPEILFDGQVFEKTCDLLDHHYSSCSYASIGISEGTKWSKEIVDKLKASGKIDSAHAFREEKDGTYRVTLTAPGEGNKLGGAGYILHLLLSEKFPGKFPISVESSGYAPRKADPETGLGATAFDIKLNIYNGKMVGEMVDNNLYGRIPTLMDVVPFDKLTKEAFKTIEIGQVGQKAVPKEYINPKNLARTNVCDDYLLMVGSGPKTFDKEKLNKHHQF